MQIRRTFALATAAVALGGGLALAPAASAAPAAPAAPGGEVGAQAMSCSTAKISNYRASGWCSGGRNWRVGVKCTDGQHYYSNIDKRRGTKYAACGSGRMTHRWIDQW